MSFMSQILLFVGAYPALISFIGAVLGGEETIILLSIIAAHGYMSLYTMISFCYLGILVSDSLWYFIGRTIFFDRLVKLKGFSRAYFHLDKSLDRATKGNDFEALLITKFLYGFRLITIMYLARERMKFMSFLMYSAIVDSIWIIVIVTIGWFAGKGIKTATLITNNLVISLIILGIFMLVFTILMRVASENLKRWLMKK